MALVKNPHLHERSKHIDIQYHHIQDLETCKKIAVSYMPIASMVVDRITKLLNQIAFQRFKDLIGMTTGTVQIDRKSYGFQDNP